MLLIETLVIFLLFAVLTGGTFLSTKNLNNLMLQGVVYSLMGIGISFVIISGNMDLSGGSVVGALVSCAAVMQVNHNVGTIPAIVLTLIIGMLIGAWHGYWIAYRKVPAFIVTLSGFLIFRGVTLFVGKGQSIGPVSDSFAQFGKQYLPNLFFKDAPFNDFSVLIMIAAIICYTVITLRNRNHSAKYGIAPEPLWKVVLRIALVDFATIVVSMIFIFYRGFPNALLVLAGFMIIFTFAANRMTFGRYTYAIGGSRDASKMSGINVNFQVFKIYVLASFCYAVASIVYLGRVGSSTGSTGINFEFSAITGCIVGGVSTLGGKGTIMGAVLGTMLMAGLDNGMSLLNLDATYQYIVRGMVLLIAVAIDIGSQKEA
jgi:D-xylose transport system permease protein